MVNAEASVVVYLLRMKTNPTQPELPMFQPNEMEDLLRELEAKELQMKAFGDAMYHAARLHEKGIQETRQKIQAICIHPKVKHESHYHPHNGDEWDEYTCLVCGKKDDRPLA